MEKVISLLKNNDGSTITLCMGWLLAVLLLCSPIYVYAQCDLQVNHLRETSQRVLDTYTVKMGKEVMKSVKNGNDYTNLLNKAEFIRLLKAELDFKGGAFIGTDHKGQQQLLVDNIKANFIVDKSLKTTISYDINYTFYFMSKPIFSDVFKITQEARYNLKM